MDVSRIEHENLFRQVDEVLRRVARVELELRQQDARIEAIENATGIAESKAVEIIPYDARRQLSSLGWHQHCTVEL